MNLIEKALRYIYIYILTSKAGLEYDLQSREVWRGSSKTVRNNSKTPLQRRFDLLHFGWRSTGPLDKRERHENHFSGCGNVYRLEWRAEFANRKWESRLDVQQRNGCGLSGRRLTSKEVAA